MEGQTTLNQYFTARKNDISMQPSKRRKLDLTTIIEPNNRNRRTCFKNKAQLEVLDLFKDSSKSVQKIEEAKSIDDRYSPKIQVEVSLKRKSTAENLEILNQELISKSISNNNDNLPSCNKNEVKCQSKDLNILRTNFTRRKLKTVSAINEQAKMTLFSRGSKLVNAGLVKSCGKPYNDKKVSNSQKIDLTTIPLLNEKEELKSQQNQNFSQLSQKNFNVEKVADISKQCNLTQFSGIIETDSAITPINKKVEPKSGLRNKYAHLLQIDMCIDEKAMADKKMDTNLCVNDAEEKPNQPAYLKYKHLLHKSVSESLNLPNKYKVILEMIRCVDSILYLLNQRKEVCTFDRLKQSVQSMNGRDFNLKHLASIKTVYPTGYVFRQEILQKISPVDYHLTIEANFKDVTSSNIITPSVLITRRLKVENILVNITKMHHQKFLQQLNINVDNNDVQRWHPDFKLNSVPDIELSLLPSAPVLKCYSSAADILLQNKKDLSCKVEKALESVVRKSLSKEEKNDVENLSVANTQTKSSIKSLKGVSNELLERIKLKEQKKIEQALTCDPAVIKRMALMEKLPEMARILKTFFTAEKKAAITLEDCLLKLCESYATAIPPSECEDLLRLLAELVPSWVTIVSVRKCPYIKLARDVDLNNVMNVLLTAKKNQDFKTV
ncbi:DNA replication factor Cdt1 isoform X2 [Hydra vulgaris]|uniref:DNA replication factor Cdt1 n=1 Tax=Hydra vulgaris TaxID=6087 RepID=T2M5T0_HYDVU|nr:DNA replication factor Cdt1 isoform X2 [Hydra vulgaris]